MADRQSHLGHFMLIKHQLKILFGISKHYELRSRLHFNLQWNAAQFVVETSTNVIQLPQRYSWNVFFIIRFTFLVIHLTTSWDHYRVKIEVNTSFLLATQIWIRSSWFENWTSVCIWLKKYVDTKKNWFVCQMCNTQKHVHNLLEWNHEVEITMMCSYIIGVRKRYSEFA